MPRKLNLAALLGLITVSVLSFSLTAGAQSEEQSEEVGATDEVAEVQETLAQKRIDKEKATEEYNNARSTLEGLNGDITSTTQNLEATENRLAAAEANLSSQAEEIYKQGNVGFADVLLDSEDASDFVTRLDLMARILITEQEQVEELRAARNELAEEAEKRAQQVQNYEETTAEMGARLDNVSAREAEIEAYLTSLDDEILAEIQAEQDRQAEAAAEELRTLLAAQAEQVAAESDSEQGAEQARLAADQLAAEENAAKQLEAQQAAEKEAVRQAEAVEQASEAIEQAQTEQEQREAQAAAEEAQAAAAEAEQKAREEASRAAEAEQAKEDAIRAAADEQAKKQAIRSAADQQAALMAEEAAAQKDAEADAAKQAIAAEQAKKAAEAAESEQERQQALAQAQEAEKKAREQAKNAEQAQQAKDAAQKALADEQQKTQPAGTQLVPPPPPPPGDATGTQPAPNQAAATPPPAPGSASADAVAEGMKWVNVVPYVAGGEDPSGMDCTGFVKWAYRGTKNLPHSIEGQAASGPQVSGEPQAGDILIWPGYHVALVTGPGMMAHASTYHGMVVHVPITDMEPYAYAVRPA